MNTHIEPPVQTLVRFAPKPRAHYSIDAAAHLAQVPRHAILVYFKHGLIEPSQDPEYGGYYFDLRTIRALRQVDYLHQQCGINLTGVRIILNLMREVAELKSSLDDDLADLAAPR